MNGNTRSGAGVFLIELLLGLMIFAFAAAICVRIFAASALASLESTQFTQAVTIAQSAAERLRGGVAVASERPERWNREGQPDENGAFTVLVTPQKSEGSLTDAVVTVSDAQGTEIYNLQFTYEEAAS